MAAVAEHIPGLAPSRQTLGRTVIKWITSTDHKTIGYLYLITSFVWFAIGGILALLIRAELFAPGHGHLPVPRAVQPGVHDARHDHAAAVRDAAVRGLRQRDHAAADRRARRRVPAAEHARVLDVLLRRAHRRRRASSRPQGAASFGWFAYAPLSNTVYSPGVGGDLWVFGLALAGFGTILGAVNFITTIVTMRAPGMTMFRMPIFTWNTLVTSLLVLMAFPPLAVGAVRPRRRPAPRCPGVQPRERGSHPVAAPVLVLRAPRGLHHRAAVLRHRHARSCRSSAASRSSATRAWSTRRSRSRPCP